MFSYIHAVDAVNVVNGHIEFENAPKSTQLLVFSLLYRRLIGEFDGTMRSAKRCLVKAGYQFHDWE